MSHNEGPTLSMDGSRFSKKSWATTIINKGKGSPISSHFFVTFNFFYSFFFYFFCLNKGLGRWRAAPESNRKKNRYIKNDEKSKPFSFIIKCPLNCGVKSEMRYGVAEQAPHSFINIFFLLFFFTFPLYIYFLKEKP